MTKDEARKELLAAIRYVAGGLIHPQEAMEIADAYAQAHTDAALADLFQSGQFELHSGRHTTWKIDCDALSNNSIKTLARMVSNESGGFGSVEGVPTGGLRLAKALEKYATEGPVLIVDDVLTIGASMEQQRAGRDAIGAVIFARGKWPAWIKPVFARPEAALADTLTLLEEAAKRGICCERTDVLEDGSCVTVLVTYVGDGEYVYSQGVSGGVEYSAVHGDDGCTRDEAEALLAKEEKKG